MQLALQRWEKSTDPGPSRQRRGGASLTRKTFNKPDYS